MRRHRQHVDAERLDAHRDLAGRLHRIGVKQRATAVRDGRQLSDRLDGANFVIGVHHRHHRRVIGKGVAQCRGRHNSGLIDL